MPTFMTHTITFTAETTLRGDEIKEYIEKKLGKGRLRVDGTSITAEKQKKPRKEKAEE